LFRFIQQFAKGEVDIVELLSTTFAEPEKNNCFSIIAQVVIRANAFSFFFSPETSKNVQHPF